MGGCYYNSGGSCWWNEPGGEEGVDEGRSSQGSECLLKADFTRFTDGLDVGSGREKGREGGREEGKQRGREKGRKGGKEEDKLRVYGMSN